MCESSNSVWTFAFWQWLFANIDHRRVMLLPHQKEQLQFIKDLDREELGK